MTKWNQERPAVIKKTEPVHALSRPVPSFDLERMRTSPGEVPLRHSAADSSRLWA